MVKSTKVSKLELVKATKKHAIELAPNLKQADLEEIAADSGYLDRVYLGRDYHGRNCLDRTCLDSAPTGLLIKSIAISKIAYALIYQNKDGTKEVIALGGVAPHPTDPQIGIPWACSSDKVRTCPRSFMDQARQALTEFYSHFPTLTNFVYSQNYTAIRWLRRLGFGFSEDYLVFDRLNKPFLMFCTFSKKE
ncbi:MAG: hypothetical protein J0G29_03775 [Alphaproteobacteria bacterium]|mgnify:CR=1 FL=1|nr:hypothetical protein [Alphaproteobacteria bacterium]OJV45250.1 MAG: hypothetical protein BGO28_00405 [Alphaproteobacteria bacterium 43-37]